MRGRPPRKEDTLDKMVEPTMSPGLHEQIISKREQDRETMHPQQNQSSEQPREKKKSRKMRTPLGVTRRRINADIYKDQYPDKVFRVINDDGLNRLNAALDAGYEFVNKDGSIGGDGTGALGDIGEMDLRNRQGLDSRVSMAVGEARGGGPMIGYLMAIDKEWYEEDQQAKNREIDAGEAALRRAMKPTGEPLVDGQYVPSEGRTIEHKRR